MCLLTQTSLSLGSHFFCPKLQGAGRNTATALKCKQSQHSCGNAKIPSGILHVTGSQHKIHRLLPWVVLHTLILRQHWVLPHCYPHLFLRQAVAVYGALNQMVSTSQQIAESSAQHWSSRLSEGLSGTCDGLTTFAVVIIHITLLLRTQSRNYHGSSYVPSSLPNTYGVCCKSDSVVGTADKTVSTVSPRTHQAQCHHRRISHSELDYAAVTNNPLKQK